MEITLRYGRNGLRVSLPDRNVRHILRFRPVPPVADACAAGRDALRRPIGTPPLRDLAAGKADACIVTSDITRPVPNPAILPVLLEELTAAGLPADRVTILIGTGSHRANTPDELREMLGEDVLRSGAQVENHDAADRSTHLYRGETPRGTPVWVNRRYAEADLKIAVSLVEPHLIAGFSGGRKAICPAICGLDTILHFHAPELLLHERASAGLLEGNPAHEEACAAAALAGAPDLMVNVTLDEERRLTGVFAGAMDAAHRAAVAHSVAQSKVPLAEPVEIALTTSAGHPLDLTFYQGVKGIAAPVRIVKPGGSIIVAQECSEGIGEPAFARALLALEDLQTYVPRVWDADFFHLDQWHAQYTKVRQRASEVFCFSGGIPPPDLARCFVTPVARVEEAVERALARHGSEAAMAVIPEGPYVLACLGGDLVDRQRFDRATPPESPG